MNPDKQRIAIAEACGWKPLFIARDFNGNPFPGQDVPPDYLNDLNAMHEAEATLAYEDQDRMARWIGRHDTWNLLHATANQRAEAFLRTIGKWEEA